MLIKYDQFVHVLSLSFFLFSEFAYWMSLMKTWMWEKKEISRPRHLKSTHTHTEKRTHKRIMNKLKSMLPASLNSNSSAALKRQPESLEPEIGFQITIEASSSPHTGNDPYATKTIIPELNVHLIAARHLPSLFGFKIVQGYLIKVSNGFSLDTNHTITLLWIIYIVSPCFRWNFFPVQNE